MQFDQVSTGRMNLDGQFAFPAPRNRNTRTEITTAASIPAKMYSSVSPVLPPVSFLLLEDRLLIFGWV
jgi:hypothetical protein